MYHVQNCFDLQHSIPFVLAIVIKLDLLQHSILVLDLLQFYNIVCASLSFHSPLLVIYFKLCYNGDFVKEHACLFTTFIALFI